MNTDGPREEILDFAHMMEGKLQMNAMRKGGWDGCTKEWLFMRLMEEMKELYIELFLRDRFADPSVHASIMLECADVANFAMMIFDNRKRLVKPGDFPVELSHRWTALMREKNVAPSWKDCTGGGPFKDPGTFTPLEGYPGHPDSGPIAGHQKGRQKDHDKESG